MPRIDPITCYRCKNWPCECEDGCTILCGNSKDFLSQIDLVDHIITDPPYSNDTQNLCGAKKIRDLQAEETQVISIDCETNGIDFRHGARPFFVTICSDNPDGSLNDPECWEWDINPLTRKPTIIAEDLRQIRERLKQPSVLQNRKFDFHALSTIGIHLPWNPGHCTLRAAHVLASNQRHDLTYLSSFYLDHDIKPYEERLEQAVKAARTLAKKRFPKWRLAKVGDPMMPSIKGKEKAKAEKGTEEGSPWRCDMWLPRALAKELGHPLSHPWWSVLRDYSNADSVVTLALWHVMEAELNRRGLYEIYLECIKALPSICKMEANSVTCIKSHAEVLKKDFGASSQSCLKRCVELSDGLIDKLPVNGRSKALESVVFGKFGLSHPKRTDKGNPSMDKEVLSDWIDQLEPGSPPHEFIHNLQHYRKRQTALSYIHSYEKFWLPIEDGLASPEEVEHYRLYPTYNPTGTVTLRGSMSNPNGQQISKQGLAELGDLHKREEDQKKKKNLRWMFGPSYDREWWSMDGQNLEMRIPAFEVDEKDLVYIFEHPDEGPYYGSYHLAICDLLYPDLFKKWGKGFKVEFEDTFYQWVKNGNFAVLYGAQQKKADLTYHVHGAFEKIRRRFPRIAALADRMKAFAEIHGYVETIPDQSLDQGRATLGLRKGYPLLCSRTNWGKILPTTPLNYHVQGTACYWMMKAMIRCHDQLEAWNVDGYSGLIILQVHDELVFDLPKGNGREPWKTNLPRVRKLKHLMELGGRDISVPTPCSMEYHASTWAEGMAL